jgi:hypothetical protein
MLEAGRCLAEPACSIDRYASLVLAAEDAKEDGVPCLDLVRGVGVPVDLPRARSCLERALAKEGSCGGSSPGLERLQLALLVAMGRGGPRSSTGAREALRGCFQDGSASSLDELISTVERGEDPKLAAVELCAAGLAQTTLHMSGCESLELAALDVRTAALEKALLAKSDQETVERFREATAAHDAYVAALADNAADLYRGGTLATVQHPAARALAERQRLRSWEGWLRGAAPAPGDPKEARRKVLDQKQRTRAKGDVAWRNLFHRMDVAYAKYRAKEAALRRSMPGMSEAEVQAQLDLEWTSELSFAAGPDH